MRERLALRRVRSAIGEAHAAAQLGRGLGRAGRGRPVVTDPGCPTRSPQPTVTPALCPPASSTVTPALCSPASSTVTPTLCPPASATAPPVFVSCGSSTLRPSPVRPAERAEAAGLTDSGRVAAVGVRRQGCSAAGAAASPSSDPLRRPPLGEQGEAASSESQRRRHLLTVPRRGGRCTEVRGTRSRPHLRQGGRRRGRTGRSARRSTSAHAQPGSGSWGSQPWGPSRRPSLSLRVWPPTCRSRWLGSQSRTVSDRLVVPHWA